MLSVLARVLCYILIAASVVGAQTPPDRRLFWDDVFRKGEVPFNKDASKLLQYAIQDRTHLSKIGFSRKSTVALLR
jgi:hypothetical protein